ncbi:hypothetical protein [Azospirillum melinis]
MWDQATPFGQVRTVPVCNHLRLRHRVAPWPSTCLPHGGAGPAEACWGKRTVPVGG